MVAQIRVLELVEPTLVPLHLIIISDEVILQLRRFIFIIIYLKLAFTQHFLTVLNVFQWFHFISGIKFLFG